MKQIITDALVISSVVLVVFSFSILATNQVASVHFLNPLGVALFLVLSCLGFLLLCIVNKKVEVK